MSAAAEETHESVAASLEVLDADSSDEDNSEEEEKEKAKASQKVQTTERSKFADHGTSNEGSTCHRLQRREHQRRTGE